MPTVKERLITWAVMKNLRPFLKELDMKPLPKWAGFLGMAAAVISAAVHRIPDGRVGSGRRRGGRRHRGLAVALGDRDRRRPDKVTRPGVKLAIATGICRSCDNHRPLCLGCGNCRTCGHGPECANPTFEVPGSVSRPPPAGPLVPFPGG